MDLTNIIHSLPEDLLDFQPDIFIAASGYESRATSVPDKFKHLTCDKIVLGFSDRLNDIARPENDKYFKEHGFKQLIQAKHSSPDYNRIFKGYSSRDIHVLVDISVMTRDWYHGLLKYLHGFLDFDHFHLRIVYCPAFYNDPSRLKKKITLRKFTYSDEYINKPKEKEKTALIIGLGNERNISEKVHDIIKPDKTCLLYADPTIEKKYVENVFIHNHGLINKTPIRFLKGYPLNDTKEIYKILIDIILPLRQAYNIIIVPQGPKIFSVLSMIFQISYPDIELYYPAFKVKQIKDRKPFNTFTAIDLEFENE